MCHPAWSAGCRRRIGGYRTLNGAPFFEPIPLDDEFVVRRAGLAYRFRPGDSADEWAQGGAELTTFTADGKRVEPVANAAEYERLATEVFGLPHLPIAAARRALSEPAS